MTPHEEVLEFWFGRRGEPGYGLAREAWFRKDPAFDTLIARRFGAMIERAIAGDFEHWAGQADSALAQVLLLDQFTRNAFRDTPRAFAGDARALAAAQAMVAAGQDRALAPLQRQFVYLPFEHAESPAMQDEAMRLFGELAREHPEHADVVTWARRHREIIERFGRFPHRNALLGRASTPEEEAFLQQPGSRF